MMTRSFFNALLNLDTNDNLKIGIYRDRKTNYDRLSLRQNDIVVKWKYEISELPPVETTEFKGKKLIDTDNVDSFLLTKLQEKFGKPLAETQKEESQDQHQNQNEQVVEEVPF